MKKAHISTFLYVVYHILYRTARKSFLGDGVLGRNFTGSLCWQNTGLGRFFRSQRGNGREAKKDMQKLYSSVAVRKTIVPTTWTYFIKKEPRICEYIQISMGYLAFLMIFCYTWHTSQQYTEPEKSGGVSTEKSLCALVLPELPAAVTGDKIPKNQMRRV